MFHVLTGQITTVLVTALSLFLFDFHPSLDYFLQAPVVLLAIFIYNASQPKDLNYSRQQEKLRVNKREVLERSCGVRSSPQLPHVINTVYTGFLPLANLQFLSLLKLWENETLNAKKSKLIFKEKEPVKRKKSNRLMIMTNNNDNFRINITSVHSNTNFNLE